MKKGLFSFAFIFFAQFSSGQKILTDDLWKGFGKFILGTDKSVFLPTLKQPPSVDTLISLEKRIYSYEYLFNDSLGCSLGEVIFKNATLHFNNNEKLIGLDLAAIYKETDSTDYIKSAESSLKKIASFLSKSLKKKGKLSYRYQDDQNSIYWYDWKKGKIKITSSTSWGKTSKFDVVILGISFWTDEN